MFQKLARRLSLALMLSAPVLGALPTAPAARAAAAPKAAVYFPNWNVYTDSDQQVKNLPWDRLDVIYHAFWKIVPQGEGYAIVSTDPWADTDESNPNAHFPQYRRMAEQYPHTAVLLSIGGWTCSGCFSQMALTPEGRASFIQSCVSVLKAYPFFSGLDLDWEYPGEARSGGKGNEGNPVLGDDRSHYTLLLRELRAALDEAFGQGRRQLTVCAAASPDILRKQDYAALFPYVDRINVMTYDMASAAHTGHHSALYGSVSADTAVRYLTDQGVPAAKICIGSPLYGHVWRMDASSQAPVGAAGRRVSGTPTWQTIRSLEAAAVPAGVPGWHAGYDRDAQAAYLWNDDPASDSCRLFYSYESEASLDAKIRYVRIHGLGGMIVWQSGGDSPENAMLTRLWRGLHGSI